ncbi:MAG: hypothetical protein FJY46_14690 [Betaproteobacteria bacterium]|nr:hypothetical protein [Betaproteobacteria bacterium]
MRFRSQLSGLIGLLLLLGACSSGGDAPSQTTGNTHQGTSGQGSNLVSASGSAQGPDPQRVLQWHLSLAEFSPQDTTQSSSQTRPLYDLALGNLSERGRGLRIALIDGTVDSKHPDLLGRLLDSSAICCDWVPLTQQNDPSNAGPGSAMRSKVAETGHATGLAALIAATENNSIGGRGIAPAATLISLNAIASGDDSRLVQALQVALGSGASVINNSWSPPDPNEGGSRSFYPAPQAWYSALDEAQSKGRSGLGAIIVKAAGNGGAALSPSRLRSDSADSANYDGYAQHPAVISVGAVDAFARPLTVSEPGAQVLVSAFSSQTNSPSLSTGTEVLPSGTSSAAAMVSALSALMLEANPGLTWRDLRWILATTARPIPGYDQPGISSAQSLLRSHGYHQQVGFGLIDAGAAVQSAKSFQGLPPLINCLLDAEKNAPIITRAGTGEQLALPWQQVAINRENSKISFSFDLAKAQCPIDRIESLMLSLASSHQDATGLRITLISPLGYGVQFAAPRDCAHTVCTNLNQGFRFHSVRFMAEPAAGRWTLQISEESGKSIGTLSRLQLSFLGH